MKNNLTVVFPQWQGGGADTSTYFGALEIEDIYLSSAEYIKVPVSTSSTNLTEYCNLIGYKDILAQLTSAKTMIEKYQPQKIFTIGGGCDADIPSIAYLNKKHPKNMALVWFDAHGDINTPEESSSKLFYGMPVRTLLGEGAPGITALINDTLHPSQVVFCGTRELDPTEESYIRTQQIPILSVQDMEASPGIIAQTLKAMGFSSVYIHLDLDVLDPKEFPHVPVPVAQGLSRNTLLTALQSLKEEMHIVGFGLYEYMPAGTKNALLLSLVHYGLTL